MPYSWRSMASDLGVYGTCGPAICMAGDIVTRFPGVDDPNCSFTNVSTGLGCLARRYVPRIECRNKGNVRKKNKQN
jgi:hypothetical protein